MADPSDAPVRRKRVPLPSYKRVRELFNYDSISGIVRWKKITTNRVKVGDIVGHATPPWGQIGTAVDGEKYVLTRIIWLWMTGDIPPQEIDHADVNNKNNAWANLRPASGSQNKANKRAQSNNLSGMKGASRCAGCHSRFVARINKEGKRYYLGTFESAAAANAAYLAKARELFGEFARAA